jgi:hypothetical protein
MTLLTLSEEWQERITKSQLRIFLRQERIQRRINVNPHPYLKNSPSAGTSLQIALLTNISPKSNSKKV